MSEQPPDRRADTAAGLPLGYYQDQSERALRRWYDAQSGQSQPPPVRQEPQLPYQRQQAYGQQPRQPSFTPDPQYGASPGQPPYRDHRQPGPPSGHRGRPARKSWPQRHKVLTVLGSLTALIIVIAGIASLGGKARQADNASAVATTTPARTATPSRTPTHHAVSAKAMPAKAPAAATSPAFPPASLAAFKAFAATGDASEVTGVGFVSNGLPSCPEPTYYVTIPSSLGVRAVEADLSAFFVQKNGFASNACGGAVVFAYHSLSDYNANKGNGFTAGRVIVTTNSPGPPYNLEVDAGADLSPTGSFSFNF